MADWVVVLTRQGKGGRHGQVMDDNSNHKGGDDNDGGWQHRRGYWARGWDSMVKHAADNEDDKNQWDQQARRSCTEVASVWSWQNLARFI